MTTEDCRGGTGPKATKTMDLGVGQKKPLIPLYFSKVHQKISYLSSSAVRQIIEQPNKPANGRPDCRARRPLRFHCGVPLSRSLRPLRRPPTCHSAGHPISPHLSPDTIPCSHRRRAAPSLMHKLARATRARPLPGWRAAPQAEGARRVFALPLPLRRLQLAPLSLNDLRPSLPTLELL